MKTVKDKEATPLYVYVYNNVEAYDLVRDKTGPLTESGSFDTDFHRTISVIIISVCI